MPKIEADYIVVCAGRVFVPNRPTTNLDGLTIRLDGEHLYGPMVAELGSVIVIEDPPTAEAPHAD